MEDGVAGGKKHLKRPLRRVVMKNVEQHWPRASHSPSKNIYQTPAFKKKIVRGTGDIMVGRINTGP